MIEKMRGKDMMGNGNNRKKWLHVRLTESEFDRIQRHFQDTVHDRISDYIRAVLMKKPVIGAYRNPEIREILVELSALNKTVRGIANNYNQTVRKLNSSPYLEAKRMLAGIESEHKIILKTLAKTEEYLHKTAQKWLQS
jgi:PP-loop superfamily ATP-utilizing enzyme